VLQQELARAAARVLEARQEAADRAEAEAYARNPDAVFWAPKGQLPPSPGLAAAWEAWGWEWEQGAGGAQQGRGWIAGTGSAGQDLVRGGSSKPTRESRGSSGGHFRSRDVFVAQLHHKAGQGGLSTTTSGGSTQSTGWLEQTLGHRTASALMNTLTVDGSGDRGSSRSSGTLASAAPVTVARCTFKPSWAVTSYALRL